MVKILREQGDDLLDLPDVIRVMEVAHVLGCGRTFVYELMGSCQLETVKRGRLRHVPVDSLETLLTQRGATPASQ